ncbi:RNA helicase [Anopheles sinensis]|uniref:RNA helicase n=1 Tax=Anopheles sinensis TaxID=74873 RepID=A0A084VYY0_ANOSI|nr:RNA helicase [Anopheles sinensis]
MHPETRVSHDVPSEMESLLRNSTSCVGFAGSLVLFVPEIDYIKSKETPQM